MSGVDRYRYTIRKICDFELLWGLFNDGWASAQHEASIAIPFWPEAEFATLCAHDEWSGYQPKSIKLDEFMLKWISGMSKDLRVVAIFPTQVQMAVYVSPETMLHDLKVELSQNEVFFNLSGVALRG